MERVDAFSPDPAEVEIEALEGHRYHHGDRTAPAPGELELLRSFLSLHDHAEGTTRSLPPSRDSTRDWFSDHGLVAPESRLPDADVDRALEVMEALRAKVPVQTGAIPGLAASRTIDAAAERAGLRLRFAAEEPARIEATAPGMDGALGRILALAFLSELDGRWERLKECGDAECRDIFYDRSRNHSGKWCSMERCGNRNKVRAFRERSKERDERRD